jgi:hypothetical protein
LNAAKAGEYHLHFWGEIENDGLATAKFGAERNFWFATAKERDIFKANVSLFAKAVGKIVAFNEADGPLSCKRTVAKMNLAYLGNNYAYEYDFGYGYPEDSAHFMFFDGNYGCDCNLSGFLRAKYPSAPVPELDCGEEISVKDFEIEYRE